MRIRSTAACLALIAGFGLALAGCGQLGQIRGMKSYKDGNKLYAGSDWKAAVEKYEETITLDPDNTLQTCQTGPGCVFFYLANSYDNLFRPAKRGEAANDALLEKAIANYKLASEKITQDEKMRTLSLEYLVAVYGPDKLNDPTSAEPVVKRMIELSPNEPTNYFALGQIYENSGEYQLAEQMFVKGRDAKPNDPTVYTVLAGYYNRQGDFAKTIATLNERIKIEPNNPEAHYTVAQVLLGQGVPRLPSVGQGKAAVRAGRLDRGRSRHRHQGRLHGSDHLQRAALQTASQPREGSEKAAAVAEGRNRVGRPSE